LKLLFKPVEGKTHIMIESSEKAYKLFSQKKYQEAIALFQSAISYYNNSNPPPEKVYILRSDLAVAMTMAKQEKPALEILHDLLFHFSHIEDTYHIGIVAGNLAVAYESLGKKELAVKYFQQASECFEKTGSKDEQYHSLHSLALLYLKLGKKFQAITALNSALNIKPKASLKDRALRKLMKTVF